MKVIILALEGGKQLRDYLNVSEVAKNIVKISLQKELLGIINNYSGNPISIRKLVENRIEKRKKKIKLNLGHYNYPDYVPMAFWEDNSKLKLIKKRLIYRISNYLKKWLVLRYL